ncbi:hypothetical protein KEM52_002512, partial [Ascosphaera acerosa]
PNGKVDIAAIRRQARESESRDAADDDGDSAARAPEPVRGAYQPVGKVDIGAIRAKAQQPAAAAAPAGDDDDDEDASHPKSLAERAAAFKQSERMTSMPKPKVTPKFKQAASFAGTRAPVGDFLRLRCRARPVA